MKNATKSLLEIIENNINPKGVGEKIDETVSMFSKNCLNCLAGENIEGVDNFTITLCEKPNSDFRGIEVYSEKNDCPEFEGLYSDLIDNMKKNKGLYDCRNKKSV